ncbi:ParA family protein [Streptomyces sp. NPDC059853]|uniref:ParA family protein n=1 Tax=Streptomyces sp. NPDC059853 TaxID=3346973 RepID=UPI003652A248
MAAQVLVVGALKGGVAKSRFSVLSALYLASLGYRVHLIDADTISQTTHKWQRRVKKAVAAAEETGERVRPWPETVTVSRHPFDDIDDHIGEKQEGVDHLIADVGGGLRSVFESALRRAHRLVVPIGADSSETEQMPATWQSAKAAARDSVVGGFEAFVLLSRTDHGTTLPREAREELAGAYPLCDNELRKNVAYQRAYGTVPTDFLHVPAVLEEIGLLKGRAA